MTLPQVLHLLGAAILLGMGAVALLLPATAARLLGLGRGDVGLAEVRAGFGGVSVGLALFAIGVHDDLVYAALGAAFLGASIARWMDIVRGNRQRAVWIGLFVDSGLAVLFLYPA